MHPILSLSFQCELSKRLPVQSQQLEKSEIRSQLTIKTPKRHQWRRSGVLILNLEQFSYLILVLQLLTLNR